MHYWRAVRSSLSYNKWRFGTLHLYEGNTWWVGLDNISLGCDNCSDTNLALCACMPPTQGHSIRAYLWYDAMLQYVREKFIVVSITLFIGYSSFNVAFSSIAIIRRGRSWSVCTDVGYLQWQQTQRCFARCELVVRAEDNQCNSTCQSGFCKEYIIS